MVDGRWLIVENEARLSVATGNEACRLLARADPTRPTVDQALGSTLSQPVSFHRNMLPGRCSRFELHQYGTFHFFHAYGSRCAFIITSLVKEFPEHGRNYFRLNPVVMDLPRASAGEKSDA